MTERNMQINWYYST